MAGLKEFMQKLAEDTGFAEGFKDAKSMEEILNKIKAAGFEVTEEELKAAAKTEELNDDALEGVAGGLGSFDLSGIILKALKEKDTIGPKMDLIRPSLLD